MTEDVDVDVSRYLRELPSVLELATKFAEHWYDKKRQAGELNPDNFGDWAANIAEITVHKFKLHSEDEMVESYNYQTIIHALLLTCPLNNPSQTTLYTSLSNARCGANTSS